MRADPVVWEIVRNRLHAINDEAATTLKRVSGSPIAVESNDLNTVITAADGQVVACGHYVLCQVASMHLVIEHLLAEYQDNPGIGPGDQFMTNDPYLGTLHQPDVVVVAPIFHGDELVAWCGSVVHQMDVGGPVAGGINYEARSIFDEPMPMPPLRVVESGRVRRDIEREYLRRSRTPEMNALDLAGQFAANQGTTEQVQALCERYGTTAVTGVMDRLLDVAEQSLRDRLAQLPDSRWRHVAYVEYRDENADEQGESVYEVRLTATKRADELELDFSDSTPQAPGAINAGYGALVNYAIGSTLIHLCAGLPWVPGGIARAIRLVSREGTIVHAQWPAGVAMSTGSTVHAIRGCVNACLARLLQGHPDLADHAMAACQSAGAGGGVLSGRQRDGTAFASMTLDEVTGGGGARSGSDGLDAAGFTTSPGSLCANVEVNESYLPILYRTRRELADSAGPGRFRGGVGTYHALSPHGIDEPIDVLSFGQGLLHPCAMGLSGGKPGGGSLFALLGERAYQHAVADSNDPHAGVMPRAGMQLARDMVLLGATQGGGGIGDPLERDPEAVLNDVQAGLVTPDAARDAYGVVIIDSGPDLDFDRRQTEQLREECRRARIGGREPRQPAPPAGQPLDDVFAVVADGDAAALACRRCGSRLCAANENVYWHLVVEEQHAGDHVPFAFRFPGSDRFVVRALYCPHCGRQLDVQVSLANQPVLQAAEPLSEDQR